ncbi:MAG: SRPBCC family protein [Caulobacterales bacterium]
MSQTASQRIQPAPVRKSVTVNATPERAFEVFTARFASWWPPSHHIGATDMKTAVLEPRVGGRWYEIGTDGAECEWGDVLVWAPPARLVLAWRIGADWKYHADLLTEVEVTFTAEGGATRVDLEHRRLENIGEAAPALRTAIDGEGGWTGILKSYADAVG